MNTVYIIKDTHGAVRFILGDVNDANKLSKALGYPDNWVIEMPVTWDIEQVLVQAILDKLSPEEIDLLKAWKRNEI